MVCYLPLKSLVTEDGLTDETGLTINIFFLSWHIINPTSHQDEFPLYRLRGNNFLMSTTDYM